MKFMKKAPDAETDKNFESLTLTISYIEEFASVVRFFDTLILRFSSCVALISNRRVLLSITTKLNPAPFLKSPSRSPMIGKGLL